MSDTLESLLEQPRECNGLIIRPTIETYNRAKGYLDSIPDAPPPEFTPDGDGGIDIEWEAGNRYLNLACSEGGQDYIYWREGKPSEGKNGTDIVVNLKQRIEWLNYSPTTEANAS